MIVYEKQPISAAEASRIKAWMTGPEADLLRELVSAQMHMHFFDSVNLRCKRHETSNDQSKAEHMALAHEFSGCDMRLFIEVFEKISRPDHGFFKLKVNT